MGLRLFILFKRVIRVCVAILVLPGAAFAETRVICGESVGISGAPSSLKGEFQ